MESRSILEKVQAEIEILEQKKRKGSKYAGQVQAVTTKTISESQTGK